MKVLKNFATVSSLLLSLTTVAHTENTEDLGPPERIKLSNTTTSVKLGTGTDPSYLPLIEYTKIYEPLSLICSIRTRSRDKCDLSLDIGDRVVEAVVNAVVQLAEKKVLVLWKEITTEVSYRRVIERVTTLDMGTCKSASSLKFSLGKIGHDNFIYTIPYKTGFHVITHVNSTSSRASYDTEGRKIGESEPYLPTHIPSTIDPLSLDLESKSFFEISRDGLKFQLSLVDETANRLIESEAVDVVTHLNDLRYSVCWDDIMQNETMVVYCAQFDLSGNEKYRELLRTIPYHDWLLEVRHARDCGLVLFAFSEDRETLHVSAIKPHRGVETLSYEARSAPGNRRVVDFDEAGGTFVFAYEADGDVERNVVLQKFHLPSGHS